MTKKSTSALIETLAMEIAGQVGCDQSSGRAFLYAAISALRQQIVEEAVPHRVRQQQQTLAAQTAPRVGPAGVVGASE